MTFCKYNGSSNYFMKYIDSYVTKQNLHKPLYNVYKYFEPVFFYVRISLPKHII